MNFKSMMLNFSKSSCRSINSTVAPYYNTYYIIHVICYIKCIIEYIEQYTHVHIACLHFIQIYYNIHIPT